MTYKTDRKCRVETGRWYGTFTGTYVDNPGDLDIDHLVALKNAHLSGGWRWDADMKEEYANYLGEENHLIAITAGANRSKGPEEWGPPDLDDWCRYATDWKQIKARWELSMTKREAEIMMVMLATCEDPPEVEVEVWETLETATGCISRSRGRSRRDRCTGRARKRSRGCREAGAEVGDFRRRWYRAPETGTVMEWCVNGELQLRSNLTPKGLEVHKNCYNRLRKK